ncbi:MAG TPA: amidohydrolase family protein [Planctomicrobium sp.]|nr:amidohydrolase family protein [Planctomicrobium sp.]
MVERHSLFTKTRYQARWVYTGLGPPIRNGQFTVLDGRFVENTFATNVELVDLGDVAVIPGLINAHTHLEFSDLTHPVEPRRSFSQWIQNVIHTRRTRTGTADAAIRRGLEECQSTGTTALAEIATSDWILKHSLSNGPDIHFFREFLGLRAEQVDDQLNAAKAFLEQARSAEIPNVGLSPHAPYSLHPKLFHGLCDLAGDFQVPVTMHLAESPAELELLANGTGPLVDLFTALGLWRSDVIPTGTRPIQYLRRLVELPRVLIAHGNLFDTEELDFVASSPNFSIAYCPRTHAAMQSGTHPWEQMRSRGIPVALGTDSRASNPDLSIWNELRFLHSRHPDRPASELLQLATANGAKALGLSALGTIHPGSRATFRIVTLPESAVDTPEQALFSGELTGNIDWDDSRQIG